MSFNPAEIIKEYLVSIGIQVDKSSVDNTNKAFEALENGMKKIGEALVKNPTIKLFVSSIGKFVESTGPKITQFLLSTEGLILAAVGSISVAVIALGSVITGIIAKIMVDAAKADIQMQMMARRMFTTVDNMRSLKAVMDAMGIKDMEQLKDVAMNPEMRAQFLSMRRMTSGLNLDTEAQKGLQNVRALGYEFQKLNIITTYFWQTFGGYLGKFLEGPLKLMQGFMSSLNGMMSGNMKRIAYDFAELIGVFGKFLAIAGKFINTVVKVGASILGIKQGLPTLFKGLESCLDILDAIVTKVDKFFDLMDSATSQTLLSCGSSGSDKSPLKVMSDYLMRIFSILDEAKRWLLSLFRPIQDMFKNAGGLLGQAANLLTPRAEAATAETSPNIQGSEIAKGIGKAVNHFKIRGGVKLSQNIANALKNVTGLDEDFLITAGLATQGHLSHAGGNAFDIGLGGKSDASIIKLVTRMLATSGVRVANLELPMPRYNRIIHQLNQQGIQTAGRVVNQWGRYHTGDNLHVGLQPLQQHVSINVHGAGDPEAVAKKVVDVLHQRTKLSLRSNGSAYA